MIDTLSLTLGSCVQGRHKRDPSCVAKLQGTERCQAYPGSQALALLVYSCSGMLPETQVGAAAVQQAWAVSSWWSGS